MKLVAVSLFLSCLGILFLGCGSYEFSRENPETGSPTEALLTGKLMADEYLDAVKEANEESRKVQQFEVNKEPNRAFNTVAKRFEYVPEGTTQKWNENTQRWEFTPIK